VIAEVPQGIYKNREGSLYEVVATASDTEDFEQFVVYRELFGEYRFWIAPSQTFSSMTEADTDQPSLSLIRGALKWKAVWSYRLLIFLESGPTGSDLDSALVIFQLPM